MLSVRGKVFIDDDCEGEAFLCTSASTIGAWFYAEKLWKKTVLWKMVGVRTKKIPIRNM